MKRAAMILLTFLLLPIPDLAQAVSSRGVAKRQCVSCARDHAGRIMRSAGARRAFMRQTGYPRGRSGYVVDHIVPLACGGPDKPSNMQWQAVRESRAKDKRERKNCR